MLRISQFLLACCILFAVQSRAHAAGVDVNLEADVKGDTARVAIMASALGQKVKLSETKINRNGDRVKIEKKVGPVKFTIRVYFEGNEIRTTVKAKDSILNREANGEAKIRV